MLGEDLLGQTGGRRLAAYRHQAVGVVTGTPVQLLGRCGPPHLQFRTAAYQMDERGGIVRRPERVLVQAKRIGVFVVRHGVQLSAYIEYVAAVQQPGNPARTGFVLGSLSHHQGFEHLAIRRIRSIPQFHIRSLARYCRPPVRVHVPIDEPDHPVVDVGYELCDPVHPVRPLRAVDRGPPELGFLAAEVRLQQRQDGRAHFLVNSAILRVADIAADVRIVRLVPHAPVPVLHLIPAPLLDAAPDDLATAGDEIADVSRIVVGRMEFGESHHRLGADIEHALQNGGEPMPLLERIRHRLVEHEDTDDLRAHQPQPPMDLLAVFAH